MKCTVVGGVKGKAGGVTRKISRVNGSGRGIACCRLQGEDLHSLNL